MRKIVREAAFAARVASDIATEERLGSQVALSCPSCGGPLWQIDDGLLRYRCHVGHGFTAEFLLHAQQTELERALWVALRTLEERANLLETMRAHPTGARGSASDLCRQERLEELNTAIGTIRRLLYHDSDTLKYHSS